MANSPGEATKPAACVPGGYLHWSRDPAVGLFAVLPLWFLYEGMRILLAPADRNGAELLLLREVDRFGGYGHLWLQAGFCVLLVFAARSLVRRQIPWLRVAGVLALEGTIYALMLGPVASALACSATRLLDTGAVASSLMANLVGSLGAGIFEELVFRLGLMSALVWLGLRAMSTWSLPHWIVGVLAVITSALVFSWFHHLCGEPFEQKRFVFRTMAGVLLGLLMWARGYGVCVYTHVVYNVHFYFATDER